jgi:diacylglycerol kinase family enzyme
MKVKILNSETDKDLMVNLDGEIYNLTHPEIYTRYVYVYVLDSQTDKDLMVNLDGEIYNLTHPE